MTPLIDLTHYRRTREQRPPISAVPAWRPSVGDLVETIGHCAKVLKVEGCVVKVEIATPLHSWETWVHVSKVKPWREPMTRVAEVMGADATPCDSPIGGDAA